MYLANDLVRAVREISHTKRTLRPVSGGVVKIGACGQVVRVRPKYDNRMLVRFQDYPYLVTVDQNEIEKA